MLDLGLPLDLYSLVCIHGSPPLSDPMVFGKKSPVLFAVDAVKLANNWAEGFRQEKE